mmetsp:Transcript_17318/g.40200  ORF Transcript_17318/g.40200 Transcript_17318/m.40200 type:complete len:296 (+) Transcript_17318:36-923(+)
MTNNNNNATNTKNIIVQNHEDPKAVVILLGWYGSKLRHIQKYSKLYEDRDCATITAHLDIPTTMLKLDRRIGKFVDKIVTRAATLLRPHKDIPLVMHAFSNGGSLVIQNLEQRIQREEAEEQQQGRSKRSITKNRKLKEEDWELVKSRYCIGASIFDSAPAYVSPKGISNAAKSAMSNKPVILPLICTSIMVFYMQMRTLAALCKGKPAFPIEYWNHWTDAPVHSAIQAYVYSTDDDVSDSFKLDDLVEIRRSKESTVITKVFEDSAHVQHLRKYPKEYGLFIDEVLNECLSMQK